jgi:oxygen-independent coproporphyrinogen-3 oxidase
VTRGGRPARERYVGHLLAEMSLAAADWPRLPAFDTLYLGGGTPSLLLPEDLARIVDTARARLGLEPSAWTFLEANPEDVTPEACAAWRGLGVRTLSLGVQSFDDEELRFLGRRHSGPDARRSVEVALAAGFHTVSVDLIYGLPGQSPEAARRNLQAAIGLGPQHLSCYQLTVHERTGFGVRAARGQLVELPDPEQAALFELTHAFLGDAGWPAYEVSNFARGEDHRSRHNRKYWDHTPYLGLGPSAHSLAPGATARSARRFWNERLTPRWGDRVAAGEPPVAGEESLGAAELALEALMLGLRTAAGLDLAAYAERYGFDLVAPNRALLDSLVAEGKASVQGGRLALSRSGLAVADGLAAAFVLTARTP